MDDADAVGLVDAQGGIAQHNHLLLQRELGGQVQGGTRDVLHGDEDPAFHLADLEHLAHVFMVHAGLGAGLQHEALQEPLVIAADELDGHLATEAPVPGQEHHSHAALAQEPQEFIAVPVRHREAGLGGIPGPVGYSRHSRTGASQGFRLGQSGI